METTYFKTITKEDFNSIYGGDVTLIAGLEAECREQHIVSYGETEFICSEYSVESEDEINITFKIVLKY